MDLTKVCRVMEWPTPTKVKEVQSFLGFINFYWKFIHDFSDITHPLCPHLQNPVMGLGLSRTGGFWCLEKGCHLCPSPHLPFPVQLLPPWMWCLELCNWSSPLPSPSRWCAVDGKLKLPGRDYTTQLSGSRVCRWERNQSDESRRR